MRREHDAYYTPSWCVDRLLDTGLIAIEGEVLEPCVGGGAIVRAVDAHHAQSPVAWTTMDIDRSVSADIHGDFLTTTLGRRFDSVVTNPPYKIAQQVVAKSLAIADQVIMLLRINWLASMQRYSFFCTFGTPHVYVLPNRPSFTGNGRTDATEYAWMQWISGPKMAGKIRILEPTSREVRCVR